MNDEPEAIIQHSTDPISIYEFGKYLYINLKSQGVEENEALKILTNTDPYYLHKELILHNLFQEGLISRNEWLRNYKIFFEFSNWGNL